VTTDRLGSIHVLSGINPTHPILATANPLPSGQRCPHPNLTVFWKPDRCVLTSEARFVCPFPWTVRAARRSPPGAPGNSVASVLAARDKHHSRALPRGPAGEGGGEGGGVHPADDRQPAAFSRPQEHSPPASVRRGGARGHAGALPPVGPPHPEVLPHYTQRPDPAPP